MYRSRRCRCCRTICSTAKSVRSPRGTVGATQSHARLEHQRVRGMGARPRAYRTSSPDGMGSSFGARTSAKTKGGDREYGLPMICSEEVATPTRRAWAFCCRAIPVGVALLGAKIIEARISGLRVPATRTRSSSERVLTRRAISPWKSKFYCLHAAGKLFPCRMGRLRRIEFIFVVFQVAT